MKAKISMVIYRIIRFFVWLFYPRMQVEGVQNLPQEPALIIANHTQMNGPIASQLYFSGKRYIWCAGQMMHLKEVPAYAYRDFWSEKPKHMRWFYKILSYIIAPVSACVFNNADTIAVYREGRIISTFKNTIKRLKEGANVIIFPESGQEYNHIVNDFQDKFVDIARLYYKKTGKALAFVPMYIAPNLKTMQLGKPVYFCPEKPMEEARKRICDYLKQEITCIAERLPAHTVVPYRNIPKKDYPSNVSREVVK